MVVQAPWAGGLDADPGALLSDVEEHVTHEEDAEADADAATAMRTHLAQDGDSEANALSMPTPLLAEPRGPATLALTAALTAAADHHDEAPTPTAASAKAPAHAPAPVVLADSDDEQDVYSEEEEEEEEGGFMEEVEAYQQHLRSESAAAAMRGHARIRQADSDAQAFASPRHDSLDNAGEASSGAADARKFSDEHGNGELLPLTVQALFHPPWQ